MASLPKTVARFSTILVNKISDSASSAVLQSVTDKFGTALSGLYGLRMNAGEANEEYMIGTISGTTVTFTVRGCDPHDGLTARTSLQHEHRKGASVEITDHPLLAIIRGILNGDQTIPNKLTYASAPSFTPGSNELASIAYADALALAGSPAATESTPGLSKQATLAQALAGTEDDGTYKYFISPDVLQAILQGSVSTYCVEDGAGSDDTYTATATPSITAYTTGQTFRVKLTIANTAAATLNINNVGAVTIKKYASGALSDLETGDIVANQTCLFIYDGTNFVLLNPGAVMPSTALLSEMATFFGSTDITAAEAEALTSGETSDQTAKHKHLPLEMKVWGNSGGNVTLGNITSRALMQISFSPDGLDMYQAYHTASSGTIAIYRYSLDSTTGRFYYVSTVTSAYTFASSDDVGIVVGNTYVYLISRNVGGTDLRIQQFTRALGSETNITISGTATTDLFKACGNDSVIYIIPTSTATAIKQYAVSGTTATRGADITSAVQGQYMHAPMFNGTDLLFIDSNANYVIKRMNTSGSVVGTSNQLSIKLNATSCNSQFFWGFLLGMGYRSTLTNWVITGNGGDTDPTVGVSDTQWFELTAATKP